MSATLQRTPVRVQRRRVADEPGIPAGAVYVGRPSWWGNPFSVHTRGAGGTVYGPWWFAVRDRPMTARIWAPKLNDGATAVYASCSHTEAAYEHAVSLFTTLCAVRRRDNPTEYAEWLAPLRGRDLACWCRPDASWCHADVLIGIANEESA